MEVLMVRSLRLPVAAAAAAFLCTLAPVTLDAASTPKKKCTAAEGQALIDQGRYDQAIREFSCVVAAEPTEPDGYRGLAEAEVLLGRYSDALRDLARVTAYVVPVHPDAAATIHAGYKARLDADPQNVAALTGAIFARWWSYQYPATIQLANQLLAVQPNDLFGHLFRGSSRLLHGSQVSAGEADIEYALALAPGSAHVRFVVADAYTYGLFDPDRAFAEASAALGGGLDTPRVHAILATVYLAYGDQLSAASHFLRHFELVTAELVPAAPLVAGGSLTLGLVPGRTQEIPVAAVAGHTVSIRTTSSDMWDTIAVMLAPDGTPVVGGDDFVKYFAGFDWVATATATYRLRVTSFESINTGAFTVTRQ
jgi:tetratricopeptide (TPR) repeat protein